MSAAVYDSEKAQCVEKAVMQVSGCALHEIIGFPDTDSKRLVVYVLVKFYGFDKRSVGNAYQMTYLYVPTVVEDLDIRLLVDTSFRGQLIDVMKALGYGRKEVAA